MEQTVTDEPSGPPLDTNRTAKAPKRKPGPKSKAPTWNNKAKGEQVWKRAREMWEAGEAVPEIAKQLGTAASSIYVKASREGWVARKRLGVAAIAPQATVQAVERHVEAVVTKQVGQSVGAILPDILREKVEEHLHSTLQIVRDLKQSIRGKIEGSLEVEEIKSLSSSLETLDRVSRRTFGLDQPGGHAATVSILCATVAPACPVIEAEIVDQPAQPA